MSWKRNPACKDYEQARTIDLDGLNFLVGHFKLGRKVVSLAGDTPRSAQQHTE